MHVFLVHTGAGHLDVSSNMHSYLNLHLLLAGLPSPRMCAFISRLTVVRFLPVASAILDKLCPRVSAL